MPQGLLTRGPAFLLDSLLVSLIVTVLVGTQVPMQRLVLITLAAEFLYYFAFESLLATTPGKRVFGLRVVRARDGRRVSPPAAAVRTIVRLFDNLLFSLPGVFAILTSPRRQRYGDRAAGTMVVSEMPEQVFTAFQGGADAGASRPDQMMQRLAELAQRQAEAAASAGTPDRPVASDAATAAAPPAAGGAVTAGGGTQDPDPCPFCDHPMSSDEIVCRLCGHYVNQVSAHGETQNFAPVPMLYSEDRRYRFDALWRLVFAADEDSLAAVRDAVPTWPAADRLLAVQAFAEVDDRRPLAFLDFLAHDPEPTVRALARDVRQRLAARDTVPPQG